MLRVKKNALYMYQKTSENFAKEPATVYRVQQIQDSLKILINIVSDYYTMLHSSVFPLNSKYQRKVRF